MSEAFITTPDITSAASASASSPAQEEEQLLLARLSQGLADGELVLYYQPKVNLRTGQVIGAEALIRWQHPELGLLPPGRFLPQAEAHDLIVDIGDWVMRTALAQIAEWQAAGLDLTVSINVAPRQMQRDNFLEQVRACLDAQPDAHPSRLEMEILESAALENTQRVRNIIEACRDWGITFALDDFGTGHSSLSYLRKIPADVLKIDQSFVRDLLDDDDDRALVEGVIGLARAFRRVVVAEGIERPEQGVLLMRMGCEIGQGYSIARPMPAVAFPEWMADYKLDEQWAAWADVPWEMEDFPLLVAQYDHHRWVDSVLNHIEGAALGLGQGELTDHHQCRFGQWYYHQGAARYGHLAEFSALEEIHKSVHRLGPEIVRLHAEGDDVQARAKARALKALREEIIKRLAHLQETVAGGAMRLANIWQRAGTKSPETPSSTTIPPMNTSQLSLPERRNLGEIKVLVVDDVPTNIELLAGALSKNFTVKFATSGARALEIVAQLDKPDLILLDVMMPEMDGYEVCRHLKEHPETRHIPVIFITAKADIADQIRGFNMGAVDYITKPFELPLVQARVRTHLNLKLRTDLLEAQASIDGLTGVPNRRQFDEMLNAEWKRAGRNLKPVSLLMINVDNFRQFNDHFGHGAGDECLRQVSMALSVAKLRPGDLVARYGGAEFVVLLPGCNGEGAHQLAERIRELVVSLEIPHVNTANNGHVTLSIGVATQKPSLGGDMGVLLGEAEHALMQAKLQGRNRVVLADSAKQGVPR